jgi:hypothetical protein
MVEYLRFVYQYEDVELFAVKVSGSEFACIIIFGNWITLLVITHNANLDERLRLLIGFFGSMGLALHIGHHQLRGQKIFWPGTSASGGQEVLNNSVMLVQVLMNQMKTASPEAQKLTDVPCSSSTPQPSNEHNWMVVIVEYCKHLEPTLWLAYLGSKLGMGRDRSVDYMYKRNDRTSGKKLMYTW